MGISRLSKAAVIVVLCVFSTSIGNDVSIGHENRTDAAAFECQRIYGTAH
jgi:hypothetical protein